MPTLTEKVQAFEKARADMARLSREIIIDLSAAGTFPIAAIEALAPPAASVAPVARKKRKRKYVRHAPPPAAGAAIVPVPPSLRSRGTKRKRSVINDATRARVRELKKSGTPVKAIIKETGISQSAVWRILASKT